MAYLKIFPIKVTDKKALDYITNPDKTDEKLLVSSFGCSPETADLEFSMTREMAKSRSHGRGGYGPICRLERGMAACDSYGRACGRYHRYH